MKKIYLILFLSVQVLSATEFLRDSHFRNGFHVLGTDDTNILPYRSENILRVEEEAQGETVWRLAEWNSGSTLARYEDYHAWANDSSSTGWRWSNPSKSVTVGFGRGSGDITLAINAYNDYNKIFRQEADGAGNWWTHLLIEQIFSFNTVKVANLQWKFDARLMYWNRINVDINGNSRFHDNPGEFVTYLLIKNKNNPDDGIWLGMTIFDTNEYGRSVFKGWDGHTNIPIYKQGVSQVGNTQSHYSMNVQDKLQQAMNELPSALNSIKNTLEQQDKEAINNWLTTTTLSASNAYVESINMGWEVRGLDIGTITIDNLSLNSQTNTNAWVSNITNSTAKLFWNNYLSNISGYSIYENGTLIDTVGSNVTSYNLVDLDSNKYYAYSIKAFSNGDEIDVSTINFQTTNIVPDAPTNMRALYVTSHSATLKWDDNSDNEEGFKIYQNGELIATVGTNTTHYNLVNLEPRTAYSYAIKSYNNIGKSTSANINVVTKDDYAWFVAIYNMILN